MQHPVKTETHTRKEEGLKGTEMASMMAAHFGPNHQGGLMSIMSEEQFYQEFMPTIRIAGQDIELGPDTLPYPETLADRLLALDPDYKAMKKFIAWLESAAEPDEILALAREVAGRK